MPRVTPTLDSGFQISVVDTDGGAVVALSGDLDAASGSRLRRVLTGLLRQRPARISVDLSDVSFMDSAGLGALLATRVNADRAGIEFRVTAPSPQVLRVLEMTGTHDRLVGTR